MKKDAPCKGCEERTVGCHGGCEKYQAFHQEREQEIRNRDEMMSSYYMAAERAKRRREQFRRREGRK